MLCCSSSSSAVCWCFSPSLTQLRCSALSDVSTVSLPPCGCFIAAPKRVCDPSGGGRSPVWARWWAAWVSAAVFTRCRPHRQDTVQDSMCTPCVCLNYSQPTAHGGSLRELQKTITLLTLAHHPDRARAPLAPRPTTSREEQTCNRDHLSAEGSSLAEVTEQRQRRCQSPTLLCCYCCCWVHLWSAQI